MSDWLVLAISMALACAAVLAATLLRHRRSASDDEPAETPNVIEYMIMMVGVVYAIVLGLAIAGVWEARGSAEEDARREAQALHEITERSQVYPAAFEARIREDVNRYARQVVSVEWPRMINHQELSAKGDDLLATLRRDITRRTPANELEAQAYQPLLDQVTVVDDARHTRADDAEATLPGVVWFGLIVGAVVTVGLVFTLRINRSARELFLAGAFTALIAFLLVLVWDFDAPFGRSGLDSASAFQELVASTDTAAGAGSADGPATGAEAP